MNNFFRPSLIDSHATKPTTSTLAPLGNVFCAGSFDHFTQGNKKGRTAKRLLVGGSTQDNEEFSHPLAKEGGFWGINKENGQQILRKYDPQQEPLDLTGSDDGP
jgi:hypothetical protein